MKLATLNENTEFERKNVEDWLLQNCYHEYSKTERITSLNGFTFRNDGAVFNTANYNIITNDKQLPFTLINCADHFEIEAPNLKNCINFPAYMDHAETRYTFVKCNDFDFSTFRPANSKPNVVINNIKNITIDKIFKNSKLQVSNLYSSYNTSIYDCSLWDNIRVSNFFLSPYAPLKNLTHILSIPETYMEYFVLWFGDGAGESIYDVKTLKILNDMIYKYRECKYNPQRFMMDMTLELIDKGFEDMT